MILDTPIPVMTGAYNRLVRPAGDPQHIANEQIVDAARTIAANAQNIVMKSTGLCNPGSGTALSPDAVLVLDEVNRGQQVVVVSVTYKTKRPTNLVVALTGEGETDDVFADAFQESYERFSTLFDLTCVKAKRESNPDATTWFSAAQYRANLDSTTATQPIEDRFPWVKQVYELVRIGNTSKALRTIYAAVEDHFKRKDFVGLGQVFTEVDVKRLNPQSMTALLRISGRARRAIPVWQSLLERTKAELERQKFPDLPGILVGLES